ncbi:MAG: hypothetical protein AB8G22_03925 [Saprospiraceae bacterium]
MAKSSNNFSWLVILIVLGAMVVLNPTEDQHKDKINAQVKSDKPLIGSIGGGKLLGALTSYNYYYLFSTTDLEGDQVSFGVLGIVVVEDIDKL